MANLEHIRPDIASAPSWSSNRHFLLSPPPTARPAAIPAPEETSEHQADSHGPEIVAVFPDGSVMWSMDEPVHEASSPGPSAAPSPHAPFAEMASDGKGPSVNPSSVNETVVQVHYHYHQMNGSRWLIAAFVAGGAIALALVVFFAKVHESLSPNATPPQTENQAFYRVLRSGQAG